MAKLYGILYNLYAIVIVGSPGTKKMAQRETKNSDDMDVSESASKFDRIRKAHQSEVAEDYVELIADLIDENGEARTVDLAARFGVTSPTVNAIIQRLVREDLVETKPYRSIFLTEKGMALAEASRQRHKIVRDFLVSIGVPEAIAEEDAEGVEHHVSPETLDIFARITGAQKA